MLLLQERRKIQEAHTDVRSFAKQGKFGKDLQSFTRFRMFCKLLIYHDITYLYLMYHIYTCICKKIGDMNNYKVCVVRTVYDVFKAGRTISCGLGMLAIIH